MRYVQNFYQEVAANTTVNSDYIVPADTKIFIKTMGGNAARSNEVSVVISFGSEILMSTHGDACRSCVAQIDGDGTSVLRISLKNDSSNAETIGGYIIGDY